MKITRRKFISQTLIAAAAIVVGPGLIPAAGKAPAAARVNPLFSGELGRYEGFSVVHSINTPMDDFKFLAGDRWTDAQIDLLTRGQAAVKVNINKANWIPIKKFIRQGCR